MNFLGKMRLMIKLKARKDQSFTLSFEDIFLEKPQEGSQNDPPSCFTVK